MLRKSFVASCSLFLLSSQLMANACTTRINREVNFQDNEAADALVASALIVTAPFTLPYAGFKKFRAAVHSHRAAVADRVYAGTHSIMKDYFKKVTAPTYFSVHDALKDLMDEGDESTCLMFVEGTVKKNLPFFLKRLQAELSL